MRRWGRQNWWPADSPFEVAVGAVLVQNTAWRNAELAIANLRSAGLLEPALLAECAAEELQTLVRPAGFQTLKSPALLGLARHVAKTGVSFESFLARSTHIVREELLGLSRIGQETADSILLYAGGHEVFVVDVYLRRFLTALGFEQLALKRYDQLRLALEELVTIHLADFDALLAGLHTNTPSHPPTSMSRRPRSPLADVYNELHAVLVRDGVEKRRPGASAPGRKKER